MTSFTEYREALEEKGVPVLGYLAWYSVSLDVNIKHVDYAASITNEGADIIFPNAPHASDVFKRACTNSKLVKVPTLTEGETYNYLIKPVGHDTDSIFHAVVRETVDTKNHVLGSVTVGNITFNKNNYKLSRTTGNMSPDITDVNEALDAYNLICNMVDDYIAENTDKLTGYALRESLRKTLLAMKASAVRSGGGVYFLAKEKHENLKRISNVIAKIPRTTFHYLPLVDDETQRKMVREAFTDECVGTTQDLMGKIAALLDKKVIRASEFADVQETFQNQAEKIKIYQKILEDELSEASSTLELCEMQIQQALRKV